MLEKIVCSCETCCDERTFTAVRYSERDSQNFFVYRCTTCQKAEIWRPVSPKPESAPKLQTVLYEVVG